MKHFLLLSMMVAAVTAGISNASLKEELEEILLELGSNPFGSTVLQGFMDSTHELEGAPAFLVKIAFINTLNWSEKASGTLKLSQRVRKFKRTIDDLDDETVKNFLLNWNKEAPEESVFRQIKDFYHQTLNTQGLPMLL